MAPVASTLVSRQYFLYILLTESSGDLGKGAGKIDSGVWLL
jgi:hypothetical protein